jgi:hypothetical protein
MPAALSSLQTPRKALTQARRGCEELITAVERAMTGRADAGWEFVSDFQPVADRLLNGLRSLNVPLGGRLEHFRDFVVRERGFTDLGLPLQRDDCGAPALDVALGRTWLAHMRDFRDSLSDHTPSHAGVAQKRGGGRPKNPAVEQLWREVAALYQAEVEKLLKDGLPQAEALSLVTSWTAGDILRKVNEANNHPFPLHGTAAAKFKKQVTRSPAWRCLRDPASLESHEEGQELPRAMDEGSALENGLRPTRARQN